jgi:hypothetical protein
MLDNFAKRSASRLVLTLLVAEFLFLDAVSYMTSPLPGCIINAAGYGKYYTENNKCPTFDVFLIRNFTRAFEAIGSLNLFIAVLLVSLFLLFVWEIIARCEFPNLAPTYLVRHSQKMEIITVGLAVIGVMQFVAFVKTDNTLQNQQRSYMFVAPAGAFNVIPDTAALQGYILLGNSGQSIAKNVRRYAAVRVFAPPGPPDIEDINAMTAEEGAPTFAPPVQQAIFRELPNRATVDTADAAAIKNGDKRIYVYGTVFYDDIFGNEHVVEFCHMYFGAVLWS